LLYTNAVVLLPFFCFVERWSFADSGFTVSRKQLSLCL
jgi:hypothetical protein